MYIHEYIDIYTLLWCLIVCLSVRLFVTIENRIYREELKESLGMNFFSPFQPEKCFKCTNYVNVHTLYAVEYINTVCSLDYPFQLRLF